MELVRFAIGLSALFVLLLIWLPTFAHGLWPYSDRYTDTEKRKTESAEVRALVFTAYWLIIIGNLLALTVSSYSLRIMLLANAIALPIAASFHFVLRSKMNKRHGLSQSN